MESSTLHLRCLRTLVCHSNCWPKPGESWPKPCHPWPPTRSLAWCPWSPILHTHFWSRDSHTLANKPLRRYSEKIRSAIVTLSIENATGGDTGQKTDRKPKALVGLADALHSVLFVQ